MACSPDYGHMRVLSQLADGMLASPLEAGSGCPCRCGHPYLAHQHYRKGSECSLCSDCARYRPAVRLVRRIMGRLAGCPGNR